jgi:multidrug efflux system membrane fusion protein
MSVKLKSLLRVLLPLFILVLCAVVATAITSMKKEPEKKQEVVKSPLIDTFKVVLKDQRLLISSYGAFKPKYQTELIAEVSGRIMTISPSFASGGMVKKGELLAQIDPSDHQAALLETQANLQRAQASLQEEIALGKVAEREWQGTTSITPTALALRKPQLAREQANVRSAQAAQARAERNLERTKIVAPYDALVNARGVDLGQFAGTGTNLGMISSINLGEIRLPVSNSDHAYLNFANEQGTVTLTHSENGLQHQWRAKIVRDEGVIDPDSRMVYLVAEVKNPYQLQPKLKFGTFVEAVIESDSMQGLAAIPSHLYRDGKVSIIEQSVNQAMGKDKILRQRDVTLFKRDKNKVYISAGLAQGDLIAVTKIEHLYDGMKVRIKEENAEPDTNLAGEIDSQLASVGDK